MSPDGAAQRVRILVVAAVCLGVAALAGAAFVLSYSGIHAVAIQAGISSRYARDYPLLIDVMLVITLLALLGLRGAGLPSRILSWLALLCVLAAAAGANVLHATGRMLRHTVGAATAAVLPWALVFIAFVLLLALLRHARLRHQAAVARRPTQFATDARPAMADQPAATAPAPSLPVRTPWPRDSASIVPGFSARLVSSAAAGAAAGAAAATVEEPGPAPGPPDHDPGDAETPADHPAEPAGGESAYPQADPPADNTDAAPAGPQADPGNPAADNTDAAPAGPQADPGDPGDPAADNTDAAPASPQAEPDDTGGVETSAGTDENGDPGTSSQAVADQDAGDDVADNMPVFHRRWTTQPPPES